MKSTIEYFYLLMAVVGAIIPALLLGGYVLDGSIFRELPVQAFANPFVTALSLDLLLILACFLTFSALELQRLGKSQKWLIFFAALSLGVAISCALPLFLYLRSRWEYSRP